MLTAVNFNTTALQQLPPHRRLTRFTVIAQAFVYPLVWLYNIFDAYINSSTAYPWDSGVDYDINTMCIYQSRVYISLQSSNLNNTPDAFPDYWMLANQYWVGATERAMYSPSKLIYEYALNRHFMTTFRQPVDGASDIRIITSEPEFPSFLIGYANGEGSGIGYNSSTEMITYEESFVTDSSYTYLIKVPIIFWLALGTDDSIREAIIRQIADKYKPAGTSYTIGTY